MAPYIRRHDEAIPLVRMGWMPFDALVWHRQPGGASQLFSCSVSLRNRILIQ